MIIYRRLLTPMLSLHTKPSITAQILRRAGGGLVALVLVAQLFSCSAMGVISDRYPASFYQVPVLLPAGPQEENPTFLVYGDSQGSWRINERFARRRNWATWKQALVPFYQLYLLGNGFVGGINYLRNRPDFGERERLMVRDAIYEEAKRSGAAFVLHLGDMAAHDGRRPDHWATFLRENKERLPLLTEVPLLPTLGNHDRANDSEFGLPNYQAIFGYPRFYTVDFPDAMLFVVDSNLILDQNNHIPDEEQDDLFKKWFVSDGAGGEPAWLERQLRDCDKPFKIVSFHHPPFPFGEEHYDDWSHAGYGNNLNEKRRLLLDLFRRSGVQVVFSGHEHFYHHSVWQYDPDNPSRGMHFIVSSGGGAYLREGCPPEHAAEIERRLALEGLEVRLVKQAVQYHFSRVTITESAMKITTKAVSDDPESPRTTIEEVLVTRP